MATVAPVKDPPLTAGEVFWDASRTPHFNAASIKDFHNLGCKRGSTARFGLSTGKGSDDWRFNSCHGQFHAMTVGSHQGFISSFRYASATDVDKIDDEPGIWYVNKFLLGKYSPFKALVKHLTIVRNSKGIAIAYIVDGDDKAKVDKGLLQNFNIASRWAGEYSQYVKSMYGLYKLGVFKKKEALLASLVYSVNSEGAITSQNSLYGVSSSWFHGSNLARLLEGKPFSKMQYPENGRFISVNSSMSSDNDRWVWGECGRRVDTVTNYLTSKPIGKVHTTFFKETITEINPGDLKKWVLGLREVIEKVISKPTKNDPKAAPTDVEDDDGGESEEDPFWDEDEHGDDDL